MIIREDRSIKVKEEPNSKELKAAFPRIKNLAIYWSCQKRTWVVSCCCSEAEAELIKEMYSGTPNTIKTGNDEEYYYDFYDDAWRK